MTIIQITREEFIFLFNKQFFFRNVWKLKNTFLFSWKLKHFFSHIYHRIVNAHKLGQYKFYLCLMSMNKLILMISCSRMYHTAHIYSVYSVVHTQNAQIRCMVIKNILYAMARQHYAPYGTLFRFFSFYISTFFFFFENMLCIKLPTCTHRHTHSHTLIWHVTNTNFNTKQEGCCCLLLLLLTALHTNTQEKWNTTKQKSKDRYNSIAFPRNLF